MRNSLERKILRITGFVIAISFIAAFAINALTEIEHLKQESMEKSLLIGETIQRSIRTIMLTGNGDIASQWTEDLREINRLKNLFVIKRDGMLAFRDLSTQNAVNKHLDAHLFLRDALSPVRILEENDERLLRVINGREEVDYISRGKEGSIFVQMKPIFSGIRCMKCHPEDVDILGVLKVATSMKEVDDGIKRIIIQSVAGCLITIIVVLVLLQFLMRTFVTKPIHSVAETIKEIIAGERLDKRVDYKSRDDIGVLVENFNIMTERLNRLYQGLEDKVQERTRQLIQAEKMASVGQLATGLVHEIRNPLGGVKLALQLLEKECEAAPQCNEDVKAISGEIQRIENLLNDLLKFARPHPPQVMQIDVNDVVEKSFALTKKKAEKAGVEIVTAMEKPLPKVTADADLLQQVFLNIILNAVNAMPGGGKLTVSTGVNDGKVEIGFTDTGHGIPGDYIGKIFDPFFTTRGASGGSGLGLTISYRIIQEHKGEIIVKSAENAGTTFTIRLDMAKEPEQ